MPHSQIFRTTKSVDFSSLLFLSCLSSFLLPLLLTPCLPLQMMSSKECQEKTASESRLGKPSATVGSFGFCQPIVCRHHLRDMIYP